MSPPAGDDGRDVLKAPRAQHRLLEHVDQRHRPPPATDLGLELAQVPRLGQRVEIGELDGALLAPVPDLHPVQLRELIVERSQLGTHLGLKLVDERGRIERLAQAA
jgi:hypothetical protein